MTVLTGDVVQFDATVTPTRRIRMYSRCDIVKDDDLMGKNDRLLYNANHDGVGEFGGVIWYCEF
jgi:hypothetical protein